MVEMLSLVKAKCFSSPPITKSVVPLEMIRVSLRPKQYMSVHCLSQTAAKLWVYILERKAPKITSACKVQQVLVCQPRSWTTCLRSAISPRIFYFALFRLKKWRYVKMKITIAFWTINCTFVKKEIWKNTKNESVVVISVFFVNYLYGRFSAITPAFWPILPVDSWSLHWVLLICRSKLGK